MAETYVPLLQTWLRLLDEGISAPITLSLSPTLMEQLASHYIQEEFVEYLKSCERQASSDERSFRARGQHEMAEIADYYRRFYQEVRLSFVTEFDGDLIRVIRELSQRVPWTFWLPLLLMPISH